MSDNACVNVCPEDKVYDKEKQACNDPPAIVIKPEDCVEPEYYIKEDANCQTCPVTLLRGYNKA